MITLKRAILVLLLAMLTSATLTNMVSAGGPYYINETNPGGNNGIFELVFPPAASHFASWDCLNGHCYSQIQQAGSVYEWVPDRTNIYKYYAHQRKNNFSGACVRYTSSYRRGGGNELQWYVDVNQSNPNNFGKYVYLGFNEYNPNYAARLTMGDSCVPNWWCGGKSVYWDDLKYSTYP